MRGGYCPCCIDGCDVRVYQVRGWLLRGCGCDGLFGVQRIHRSVLGDHRIERVPDMLGWSVSQRVPARDLLRLWSGLLVCWCCLHAMRSWFDLWRRCRVLYPVPKRVLGVLNGCTRMLPARVVPRTGVVVVVVYDLSGRDLRRLHGPCVHRVSSGDMEQPGARNERLQSVCSVQRDGRVVRHRDGWVCVQVVRGGRAHRPRVRPGLHRRLLEQRRRRPSIGGVSVCARVLDQRELLRVRARVRGSHVPVLGRAHLLRERRRARQRVVCVCDRVQSAQVYGVCVRIHRAALRRAARLVLWRRNAALQRVVRVRDGVRGRQLLFVRRDVHRLSLPVLSERHVWRPRVAHGVGSVSVRQRVRQRRTTCRERVRTLCTGVQRRRVPVVVVHKVQQPRTRIRLGELLVRIAVERGQLYVVCGRVHRELVRRVRGRLLPERPIHLYAVRVLERGLM